MIYDIQFELFEAERFTTYLKKTNVNIIDIFKIEKVQGKKMFMGEFKKHLSMFRRVEKINKIMKRL